MNNDVHKGDDIASTTKSWLKAVLMNVGMRFAGHLGNDLKILIDHGSIEFLRNFTQKDGIMRGYLNRTIPNLICKDL